MWLKSRTAKFLMLVVVVVVPVLILMGVQWHYL